MNNKKCPKCGRDISPDKNFCPYCMENFNKDNNTKKLIIVCVTVVIVVAILVAGFVITFSELKDNNNNKIQTTATATESTSQTTTTATNTTVQATTKEVPKENRVSFGEYSLVLPKDWAYVTEDDRVSFYEKYNLTHENTGSKGFLCSIIVTTENAESVAVNASMLGTKDGKNYISVPPTGFGIIEDETANQKFVIALHETDNVLDSFKFE